MAGERGIKKIEVSTDYDWDLTTGTWTEIPITEILLDGTVIAEPEEFSTEKGDNITDQDGIRWNGTIRVQLGTTEIPAENTAFWLRVTPHSGSAKVYGGLAGARGRILETGLQALSTGRPYIDLNYQFVGVNSAAAIQ